MRTTKVTTLDEIILESSQIKQRVMTLAVPDGTNPSQWQRINRAIDYARGRGVSMEVTIVK